MDSDRPDRRMPMVASRKSRVSGVRVIALARMDDGWAHMTLLFGDPGRVFSQYGRVAGGKLAFAVP